MWLGGINPDVSPQEQLSLRASDYHIYISTASIPNCPQKLLQDEVSAPSALAAFEKKTFCLWGNFVLAWAYATLSQLGNSEFTEFIVGVLSNLVEGEILREDKLSGASKMERAEFEYWVPGMSKSII